MDAVPRLRVVCAIGRPQTLIRSLRTTGPAQAVPPGSPEPTLAGPGSGRVKLVAVVALVLVPALLLVWLRSQEDHLEALSPDPEPILVEVAPSETTGARAVLISVELGATPLLVAEAPGVVREWLIGVGDVVVEGTGVLVVDDQILIGVASRRPFWRVLKVGMSGDDVQDLESLLVRLGYLEAEPDDFFTQPTADAVRSLATDLGVGKPDGSFDPGWTVWLPDDRFEVKGLEVRVGQRLGGPGSVTARGVAPVTEATITQINGEPIDAEGHWMLAIDDDRIPVVDGQIGDNDRQRLASYFAEGNPTMTGVLERAEPITAFRVPAAAVVSGASGDLCVWVGTAGSFSGVAVSIIDGRAGTVDVRGDLHPGDPILANPQMVLENSTCP